MGNGNGKTERGKRKGENGKGKTETGTPSSVGRHYPKGTGSTYRSFFAVCRWRCPPPYDGAPWQGRTESSSPTGETETYATDGNSHRTCRRGTGAS